MQAMKKVVDKVLEVVCMSLMVVMTCLVTWQVFTRYVLNNPSAISEVLAKYLFVWLVLFGAAYVFGLREHMAITFIKEKIPLKVQYLFEIFAETIIALFSAGVMIQGGLAATIKQMAQMDSSLKIPMGVIYAAIPAAGILIIFYCICNIVSIVKKIKKGE